MLRIGRQLWNCSSLSLSLYGPKGGWPSCITFVRHITCHAGPWLVAMALCRLRSLWMMGSLHAAEKIASARMIHLVEAWRRVHNITLLAAERAFILESGQIKKTPHKEFSINAFRSVCTGRSMLVEVHQLEMWNFARASKLNYRLRLSWKKPTEDLGGNEKVLSEER